MVYRHGRIYSELEKEALDLGRRWKVHFNDEELIDFKKEVSGFLKRTGHSRIYRFNLDTIKIYLPGFAHESRKLIGSKRFEFWCDDEDLLLYETNVNSVSLGDFGKLKKYSCFSLDMFPDYNSKLVKELRKYWWNPRRKFAFHMMENEYDAEFYKYAPAIGYSRMNRVKFVKRKSLDLNFDEILMRVAGVFTGKKTKSF